MQIQAKILVHNKKLKEGKIWKNIYVCVCMHENFVLLEVCEHKIRKEKIII